MEFNNTFRKCTFRRTRFINRQFNDKCNRNGNFIYSKNNPKFNKYDFKFYDIYILAKYDRATLKKTSRISCINKAIDANNRHDYKYTNCIINSIWRCTIYCLVSNQDARLLQTLSILTVLPWAFMGQATIIHNIFTIVNRIRLNSILVTLQDS